MFWLHICIYLLYFPQGLKFLKLKKKKMPWFSLKLLHHIAKHLSQSRHSDSCWVELNIIDYQIVLLNNSSDVFNSVFGMYNIRNRSYNLSQFFCLCYLVIDQFWISPSYRERVALELEIALSGTYPSFHKAQFD